MRGVAKLSAFVGRESEIAALVAAVREGCRLIGVWGPLGGGKTRLALELCRALTPVDGRTDALVIDLTVAPALDAASVVLDPAGAVGVIVLDGADAHLDQLASLVPRWAERDAATTFVVTSRQRCRLDGARALELEALSAPDEGADSTASPAVALFLDRARSAARSTATGAARAIVTRLEGLPLFIERAAALLPSLGLDALLDLAGRPLELLAAAPETRGSPDGAKVVAALRASVERLPPRLRKALAVLTHFESSFSIDDVAAVLGCSDSAAAEMVAALRDRSLLRGCDGSGAAPRHRPWAWVRAVAREMQRKGGNGRRAREAVALRVLEGAAHDVSIFDANGSGAALGDLAARRADLVAIAERALDKDEPVRAAVLRAAEALVALDPLLLTYGPRVVDRALLDRAVSASGGARMDRVLKARLLCARARSCALTEGAHAAVGDLERAVALVRDEASAGALVPALLVDLGVLHHRERELETATALYTAALDLCAGRDPRTEARAIGNLAAIAHDRGRLDAAAPEYERAIAIAAAAGDLRLEAIFSANLAIVEQERGAMRSAQRRYQRGVQLLERIPDRRLCAITLGNLGMLHHEEGRLEAARRCHERALAELSLVGDAPSTALAHGRLAATLASEDRVEEARVEIERGTRAAPAQGGEVAATVLHVASAYLDVALARRAVLEGRDGELATRLARARRRADEARAALAPDGIPLADTSDDLRTFLRVLGRSLDASSGGVLGPPDEGLLVAPEARWFRPPGGSWHDLRPRTAARRILDRLCAHQVEAPGTGLGLDALRDAGWPGERILAKAAKNRVYVVLNQLRELGLRRWIRRTGDGWALDPMLPVHRVAMEPVGVVPAAD
jgi:tetratricopeptide (TPR) repeat protein